MNKKMFGIALIIVGAALAVWGYNLYDSAGSHLSRAFGGGSGFKAWFGMVAGALCVAFGALKLK